MRVIKMFKINTIKRMNKKLQKYKLFIEVNKQENKQNI